MKWFDPAPGREPGGPAGAPLFASGIRVEPFHPPFPRGLPGAAALDRGGSGWLRRPTRGPLDRVRDPGRTISSTKFMVDEMVRPGSRTRIRGPRGGRDRETDRDRDRDKGGSGEAPRNAFLVTPMARLQRLVEGPEAFTFFLKKSQKKCLFRKFLIFFVKISRQKIILCKRAIGVTKMPPSGPPRGRRARQGRLRMAPAAPAGPPGSRPGQTQTQRTSEPTDL